MLPPGWMIADPMLKRMASEVIVGSRPSTSTLGAVLEGSRDRQQIKRIIRFLRWTTSQGQELAGELAESLDRRMAEAVGVSGTSRTGYGRDDPGLASSCISALPFEPPAELRIRWLLALVRWPVPQATWPEEQWSMNRHAAQALLRLDRAFGPLVDDPGIVARIQAVAGTDPENRWAAMIDLADLRLTPGDLARFRPLGAWAAGFIPPPDSVPRCPICRQKELSWAREFSPAITWQHLCGREWLVRFCPDCCVVLWTKLIGMN